jgi:hypothetical protein
MESLGISCEIYYGISYGISCGILWNPIEYHMKSNGISYGLSSGIQ